MAINAANAGAPQFNMVHQNGIYGRGDKDIGVANVFGATSHAALRV